VHDFETVFDNQSFRSVITTSTGESVFVGSDRGLLKQYSMKDGSLVKDFGEIYASVDLKYGIYSMAVC